MFEFLTKNYHRIIFFKFMLKFKEKLLLNAFWKKSQPLIVAELNDHKGLVFNECCTRFKYLPLKTNNKI